MGATLANGTDQGPASAVPGLVRPFNMPSTFKDVLNAAVKMIIIQSHPLRPWLFSSLFQTVSSPVAVQTAAPMRQQGPCAESISMG